MYKCGMYKYGYVQVWIYTCKCGVWPRVLFTRTDMVVGRIADIVPAGQVNTGKSGEINTGKSLARMY